MTGVKNIMSAMKRAVSPDPQRASTSTMSPCTTPVVSRTPLTDFMCSRLQGEKLQLFGLMFAEAIKNDRHAEIICFEDVFKFLGYTRYDSAVKQLKRSFPGKQTVSANGDNLRHKAEVAPGPSKDRYLISVRQFETLMLNAQTTEGSVAREMMLDVKDAVQDYIKMEMEEASRAALERERVAQQQLEEETCRRLELETVQIHLQAAIESQKRRDEKKEARKKQQKEPLQTAYLMSNNANGDGPYKAGKTGKDAEKRRKEMQTGNHEQLTVVSAVKCMKAKLIEDAMHHIFTDYRINDDLEWFDAPKESMISVSNFLVTALDGLNAVDHDDFSVAAHLNEISASFQDRILNLPKHPTTVQVAEETEDEFAEFLDCLEPESNPNKCLQWNVLKERFRAWHDGHCAGQPLPHNIPSITKKYFSDRLGGFHDTNRGGVKCVGFFGWRLKD